MNLNYNNLNDFKEFISENKFEKGFKSNIISRNNIWINNLNNVVTVFRSIYPNINEIILSGGTTKFISTTTNMLEDKLIHDCITLQIKMQ